MSEETADMEKVLESVCISCTKEGDEEKKERKLEEFCTALIEHTMKGNITAMQEILEAGTDDIHQVDIAGLAPLMWAARTKNIPALKLLLSYKADPNNVPEASHLGYRWSTEYYCPEEYTPFDKGLHPAEWWSPLMYACQAGSLEAVQLLISHGAKINYKSREKLCDPVIIVAAKEGNKEVMDFLLSKGANQNQVNFEGMTALLMAALNGHLDCVKLLLKANSMVFMGEQKFMRFDESGYSSIGLKIKKCKDPEMRGILLAAGCQLPWVTHRDLEFEDDEEEQDDDDEDDEDEDDCPENLKILCKDFIRKQLLQKYWMTNLFCMVPDLPLPTVLKRYLLDNVGFVQEILDERIKK